MIHSAKKKSVLHIHVMSRENMNLLYKFQIEQILVQGACPANYRKVCNVKVNRNGKLI